MYVDIMTILTGWIIVTASFMIFMYALILFAAFHTKVITSEEPSVEMTFGAIWLNYKRSVPRWVPRRLGYYLVRSPHPNNYSMDTGEFSFRRETKMPKYRVMIHGSNFRLKLDGKWDVFGFYTPRYTIASEIALAEQTALEEFRKGTKYQDLLADSLNSDTDPPILRGEDIEEECDPDEDFAKGPPGLGFYSETEEGKAGS